MPNKVVVITGASSGIGEATAYAFAEKGWVVVITARDLQRLGNVKSKIESKGAQCLAVACDVSREEDCKRLMETTISSFGRIDVLINNAGMSMRALFAHVDLSVLKQLMEVNFWGTVYCTKYAIQALLESKGSVVAVSSVAGFKGLPARTGYSASKFAINGFMESLRIENLKTGLHVGVIAPGYTASNIRNTALNKDGKAQSESPFDESKLMPSETVAGEILKMVINRTPEKVLTLQGKMTRLLNKFFPRWLDQKVFNLVSRERDSPF